MTLLRDHPLLFGQQRDDMKKNCVYCCIINIPVGKTALIDGLDGYIVIQSEDKLMILKKENEQELKEFLKLIKK